MKQEQVYQEMCGFLHDKPDLLASFQDFYTQNKDRADFLSVFDAEYGGMYESLGGQLLKPLDSRKPISVAKPKPAPVPPVPQEIHISEQEYRKDVRTIRKWVEIIGWLIVIGVVASIICGIVIVL